MISIFTLGVVIGAIVVIGFIIKSSNPRKSYWEERGVTEINRPDGVLKSLWKLVSKQKNLLDFDTDLYLALGSKPFGGISEYGSNCLLVKDPELIKQIMVKDFDYFVDRKKIELHSKPILELMVSLLEGQEWKNVRSAMSPTFTTGKIRRMFQHFNNCGADLVQFIKSKPVGSPGSRDVVVKEAFSRYLVDIIGATAFGINTNALKDPHSMFYKMAKRFSDFSVLKIAKAILAAMFPFLKKFGLSVLDTESVNFFENISKSALKARETSSEKRDDFLQMMLETRCGSLKSEDSNELEGFEKDAQISGGKTKVVFTDDMITAQSMLFFLTGLDTTGSVLSFTVYLLALHQDIQAKLYNEISGAMTSNQNKLDYDAVMKFEYLDKIISEILRLYPTGARLDRKCTKDYKLPGSDVTIELGTIVFMTVKAMQRDPQYFPNPDKFDPERFTAEEKGKRNPYTYMPFGHGPRNCIGMRFALMEAKIAIAYLVHNFVIEPCENTPVPVKIDPNIGTRPVVDLELRFRARNLNQ